MSASPRSADRIAIVASADPYRTLVERALATSAGDGPSRVTLIRDAGRLSTRGSREVLVLTDTHSADETNLPRALQGRARYVVFVTPGASESAAGLLMRLGVRSRERFILADMAETGQVPERFIPRFVHGLAADDDEPRILTAFIDDETLHVRSPRFDLLTIPLEMIARRLGGTGEDWSRFDVDPFGRFIHWPARDAHMGWKHLTSIINPVASIRDQQDSAAFNRRYGAAIRRRRKSAGLTQDQVPGVSVRNLGRIERGELRASAAALARLAAAHGETLPAYLSLLAADVAREMTAP
jgi:hypothetical protein